MFDGLKNKLNSFTQNVEEDAEIDEEADTDDTAEPAEESTDEAEESVQKPAAETDAAEKADTEGTVAEDTVESESASGAEYAESDTDADSTAQAESEQTAEENDNSGQKSYLSDSISRDTSKSGTKQETDEEQSQEDQNQESETKSESEQKSDGRGLTERAKLLATGQAVIDEDALDSHLEYLEFALLGSDVELEVAQEILDGVEENLVGKTRRRLESTGNLVQDALREALYDVISVGQFDFDERVQEADKPFVITFTGVNGVGKTTTIAKFADYFEKQGLSSVLANGDTYRAGANEQLEQHADNLGKRIISHEKGSDPAAVIYDAVEYAEANDVDVVLGDTAGRLHTSDGLMDQLSKIDRVIDPDMTIFVDEAVAGQDAVKRAKEFDDASDIDGTILTKADADSQGGAAISVAHVTGKPILFLGTGQDYEDIEQFDPERIVNELLG